MNPPVFLYRIGHFLHKKRLSILGKLLSYTNRLLFGVWLPSSAQIGKNFTLGYWGIGIVIHSNTKIGEQCLVSQNVTIGRNFGDTKVPVLGDNVYVGTGSVIFGEITIGDNVIIGSNTLINKDIPANTTVVGNPFKIIATDRHKKYWEYD